jgi:SpoVK/Ycf46/Vps4 family AAA+-type ATPase
VITSFTSAVKIGIREYQENSTQHQFAASIKNLFHLQTQAGENQYQASDYQISRSGSLYEIKESATDRQIMQFRSTPLGLKVERSNLEKNHISDLTTLQTSLQQNERVPTSFAPAGKQEAEYFARVERITNALVQYAVTQQKEVTIDGAFSYQWQANPDGNVRIEAKDGRGNLLEKTRGKVKSNMSDRDLVYFEQILPKLQASSKKEAVNSPKLTDKLFAASNESGEDISSRQILGTLLTWLQDKTSMVFVVATLNRLDALPPELTRVGRFDEIFYVGFPQAIERKQILMLHLTRFDERYKHDDVLTEKEWRIILNQTVNCTGAELARMVEKAARALF